MARRSTGGPSGLVVIDKEAGWTSHDVVAKLRRILGQRRTGHAGTLDPSATGVLLVGAGRATRLLKYLEKTTKVYDGTLVLGSTTTTLDADGEVTASFAMDHVRPEDVQAQAGVLTGDLLQVPPMVSALKVDGVRLHELARKGIEVDREARPVHVARFEVSATADPARYDFVVECSAGTYIRSLVDDLGRALGGGAHLGTLRRTRVGVFGLEHAHRLDELAAARERGDTAGLAPEEAFAGLILSMAEALGHLPVRTIDAAELDGVSHGRPLSFAGEPEGPLRILTAEGELVAVYRSNGADTLAAEVVLLGGDAG